MSGEDESVSSMTIRDRFVMAALTGELAAQSEKDGVYTFEESSVDLLVQRCYTFADAMMEARKERTE